MCIRDRPFTLSDAMGRILMDEPIRPGEGILHHPEGVDLMLSLIHISICFPRRARSVIRCSVSRRLSLVRMDAAATASHLSLIHISKKPKAIIKNAIKYANADKIASYDEYYIVGVQINDK